MIKLPKFLATLVLLSTCYSANGQSNLGAALAVDSTAYVNQVFAGALMLTNPLATHNVFIQNGSAFLTLVNNEGIVSTVIGTGVDGHSGDHGPGLAADISSPASMQLGPDGSIYFTELDQEYIRRWYPDSDSLITIAGNGVEGNTGNGGPADTASLNLHFAFDVDSSGSCYFYSSDGYCIRRIDATTGIIDKYAGSGSPSSSADSIHIDSANIWFGSLRFAPDGTLYGTNLFENKVQKIVGDSIVINVVGPGSASNTGDGGPASAATIQTPRSVAVDNLGQVYICTDDIIRKIDTSGIITTFAGTGVAGYNGDNIPASTAQLDTPEHLNFFSDSILSFSDAGNNLLRTINLNTGIISSYCGQVGVFGFSGDGGPALSATHFDANDAQQDQFGNIYFADRLNHRIRKISGPSWTLTGTPTCQAIGPHPVTIGVTDGIDTVYQSFTITVQDTVPPTLTCPQDFTAYTTDTLCGALVQWTPPTGTDDCSSTSAITTLQTDSNGLGPSNYFGPGIHYIEYTTTDSSGNSATCSFNVTVLDTIQPSIVCPTDTTLAAVTNCEATISWNLPTAVTCGQASILQTDNSGLNSGDAFPIGTTEIRYVAIDGHGDSLTCSFNVVVQDTLAPDLSCANDTTVHVTTASCEAPVTWPSPTAADLCGSATIAQTDQTGLTSGDNFPLGTTTLEYEATDASGNTSQCALTVTVIDTVPPAIGCEDTIASTQQIVSWPVPQVTDNCFGPALQQTAGPASGSTFDFGTTTVEYTATDVAGNETVCTMIVLVDTIIGLPELSLAQKVYAYPNPTSGQLTIALNDPQLLNKQLTVLNSMGQPVLQEQTKSQTMQLDLSSIEKGVYFLQVETPTGPVHQKLIVQ